ncbi:Uncharacterised protein [Mycobacteroides abscessus subsp. massiliense]|nr:Uncharacterised protein [Mycobacteroides abscessus subsp. massiliense]
MNLLTAEERDVGTAGGDHVLRPVGLAVNQSDGEDIAFAECIHSGFVLGARGAAEVRNGGE